jgi:hypothetical protein
MKKLMIGILALGVSAIPGYSQGPGGHRGPGGPGGFGPGGPGPGAMGKVVTGAPVSATFTTTYTQTLADGNVITRTNTSTFARDSQGRTVTTETVNHMGPWSSSTGPKTMTFIFDPVAGFSYTLDATTKTAFQRAIPPKHADAANFRGHGPRNDPNTVVEQLVAENIQGVVANGTKSTRTIPAGTMGNQNPIVEVNTRYFSPELQMVVSSSRTDPRTGTSTFQASNISRNEPPASLFQVPAGYTVTQAKPQMRVQP